MNKSDGLDAFDGFVRDAADAGMFNDDQLEHMRQLSVLPREAKCGCGWYPKGECYSCNLKALADRGGRVEHTWKGTELRLPDGRLVDYTAAAAWLRAAEVTGQPQAGAAGEGEGDVQLR
jgi:hypothetical protein